MLVESTGWEKEGGRCIGWWRNEDNFWGRYRGGGGGFWKGKKFDYLKEEEGEKKENGSALFP